MHPSARRGRVLVTATLTPVVAIAFADASIVVLALPAIYREFGTTVVGVSWVLTGYAVTVVVAAALIAAVRGWSRPTPLTLAGLTVFAAGSLWCGLATSLAGLMAGRVVQGIGAAALLAGALELLCRWRGHDGGRRLWSASATVGLAAGPAVGGALTELSDWRTIFLVQAPVVALTLVVMAVLAITGLVPVARGEHSRPAGARATAVWAGIAYVLLFAGLVGALFLSVLMLVEVWRMGPLRAAAVMMALPAGMLLTQRGTAAAGRGTRVAAGATALAGGLLTLALLPAANPVWAGAALLVGGAGAGMVLAALAPAAVPSGSSVVRAGALVVVAKHAGLVLGLLVTAPLLAGALDDGERRAVVAGTGLLLDSRLPLPEKIRFALAVRDTVQSAPRGAVPDLRQAAERAEVPTAGPLVDSVEDRLRAVLTRSFRPAFLAAAALALLTVAAALALRQRPPPAGPGGRAAAGTVAVVLLLAAAAPAVAVAAGGRSYGRYAESAPCAAPADPYPGSDPDALLQRIAYGALHGAACELGMSRERFVLALAGQPGFATVAWDEATVERAVRAAIDRALDDARQRGDLPAWLVSVVQATIRDLPLDRILAAAGLTPD